MKRIVAMILVLLLVLTAIPVWASPAASRYDVNADGVVSIGDVSVLLARLGTHGGQQSDPGESRYDINGDGTVSIGDVSALLGYLANGGPEPEDPEEPATELQVGMQLALPLQAGTGTWTYSFVPEEDGAYRFYSVGSLDTWVFLYDGDMEITDIDDDSGFGHNFSLTATFTAGETYYFEVCWFEEEAETVEGEVSVILTLPCDHVFTVTKTVEPSCTEEGYTVYTCVHCGEDCREDWVDPLGHEYVDGVCVRCGDTVYAIKVGERLTLPIGEEGLSFSFSPEEDGNYRFFSLGADVQLLAMLTDADFDPLFIHGVAGLLGEDETEDGDFSLDYPLLAGQTYYFVVGMNGVEEGPMEITVGLEKECLCAHSFYTIYELEPECEEDGMVEALCLLCAGLQCQRLPARGHRYVDGVCNDCGAKEPV